VRKTRRGVRAGRSGVHSVDSGGGSYGGGGVSFDSGGGSPGYVSFKSPSSFSTEFAFSAAAALSDDALAPEEKDDDDNEEEEKKDDNPGVDSVDSDYPALLPPAEGNTKVDAHVHDAPFVHPTGMNSYSFQQSSVNYSWPREDNDGEAVLPEGSPFDDGTQGSGWTYSEQYGQEAADHNDYEEGEHADYTNEHDDYGDEFDYVY
jgi:hypothetical protein